MKKLKRLWHALEATPVLTGVTAAWREAAGEDFDTLAKFLRPMPELATTYPCPEPGGDGCPRGVIVHGPDDIVAVCRQAPRSCDAIALTRADIIAYELDLPKFAHRLREAFGFTDTNSPTPVDGLARTLHLGDFRPAPGSDFPVYVTVQYDPEILTEIVERLCARDARRYVLLTPTSNMIAPACRDRLSARRCVSLGLSECVEIDPEGNFVVDGHASRAFTGLQDEARTGAITGFAESYPKDQRIFQKQGATWLLVYDGLPKSVGDSVGMSYICRLLQNPGQDTHASTLRSAVVNEGESPLLGSAGDMLDDRALKEYRERLKDLEEELREAEENHDIGRAQRLKEEVEAITAEIGRATGLRGRNRKAADDRERARQAVSTAIHRALRSIKKEHEPLWQHLHNSLQIGEFLSYQPDQPTAWTT